MIQVIETGSTISHLQEKSLWQRLWICRKTKYGIKAAKLHAGLLASGFACHMLVSELLAIPMTIQSSSTSAAARLLQ
jgi:hypothetical protein